MSNGIYGKARQAFLTGDIDWASDTIKVMLVDTAHYTVSIDADEFLDDIDPSARVGSAVTLSSKTSTLGVADADDVSFTGLTSAPTIEALVIYQDTGTESTSRLIAYMDSDAGLPVAANATQVDVTWGSGSDKIFKL